jgi:hypothetical protein
MIHFYKAFFIGLTISLLAGCTGPLVRIESIDKRTIDRVQVFADKSILQNPNVRIIGVVDATSCRNLAWEPPASIENCTMQMQMRAAKVGANGIVLGAADDKVADFLTTGINRNCWSTVDCTGVAVIVGSEQKEMK